jgi:hypothetical protein
LFGNIILIVPTTGPFYNEREMTQETKNILYDLKQDLDTFRRMLDSHMYGGDCPQEDKAYCIMVYDKICEVEDLL